MEIPMPVKVRASVFVEVEVEFESMFGNGSVRLSGPTDKDKDKNPEFTLKVDLPGKALDFAEVVEIPLGDVLTKGGPQLVVTALKLVPVDFPGKGVVTAAVEHAVEALLS